MSPLRFFSSLVFANDPFGSEVNYLWKDTRDPLLICWYRWSSPDGRRDEEIRLVLTAEKVSLCSITRRTGYQWQEQELKSGKLARKILLLCGRAGLLERKNYPEEVGLLTGAVLAVRCEKHRFVARMWADSAELIAPVGLLRELEHPGSEMRRKLDDEFFPRVEPLLKTPTPDAVWEVDPNICMSCDRRLSATDWNSRGRTAEGGTLCPECARVTELLMVDCQGDGVNGFREIMVRQISGKGRRKLLESKEFSFVVFLDKADSVTGFHLSGFGPGNILMWKKGEAAEAFYPRNVSEGGARFDVFVKSEFETEPVLANLKTCGGNIRPGVMAALREGLESIRSLSPVGVGA